MNIYTILSAVIGFSYVYSYAEWDCNYPLLDNAVLIATSSLNERGPENARLNGPKAWSAQTSNFEQQLIIDLGQVKNVTRIRTQGRPLSNEFVQEYTISYGTNGQDYAIYKDASGNIKTDESSETSGSLRLFRGVRAWQPADDTYYHFLAADLGKRRIIKSIATQGSQTQFVTEYILQYSDDTFSWRSYTDRRGYVQMFKGNTDGTGIQRNVFEVPIIAQWVRVNPTRWNERISLRMELYGCDYLSEHVYLNGSSLITVNLVREAIAATRETFRFRFKTSKPNGVLLYSRGTQGDFIALQMRDNRMLLNMDLGSGVMTSLSAGSLLDDNLWHDVVISRNRRDIKFNVDRVEVDGRIKGEFVRLNLNRELHIGGVPEKQDGLVVVQNFTGCMENFYINDTNLIEQLRYAYVNEDRYLLGKYRALYTGNSCPEPPVNPVTFLTATSFARLQGYEGMVSLNVSLSFRTYENAGLLVYHKFSSAGQLRVYLEGGKLKIEVQAEGTPKAILDNFDERFNDGRWHDLIVSVQTNLILVSMDRREMRTERVLAIRTGTNYLIAGGVYGQQGFIGCMQRISIDGNYIPPVDWKPEQYCCKEEVVFSSCHMMDRCNPNPCRHGGICLQNHRDFYCDCAGTGYTGPVCHTSIYSLSCEAYKKNANPGGPRAEVNIDVDGSGPLLPFAVTCEFLPDGRVDTVVHHASELPTPVDGFQEPGSFVQDIVYDADLPQMEALLNRSVTCRQRIHYACRQSRLMTFGWWVSRNSQKMDYWGGALPGSQKCDCGVTGSCADPHKACNCDSGLEAWTEDGGDITQIEHLPVKQVRFGDTGHPLDEKEGRFTLGPLICTGDKLFSNVVTFRISDAAIKLPTFDMGHSGDIYFEFKTTATDAVMVHSTGPADYIQIAIQGGNRIVFQYQAGSGTLGVTAETAFKLADNNWHSVSVERSRKGARVVIDGSAKNEVHETSGPIRALHLTSPLMIGSTVDYRDGYVGCMRAFMLNGEMVDLWGRAHPGVYGVSQGCIGKCDSSPCLNNGTCIERFDGYTCDCRWTSFKGPICADEIGMVMRPASMIKYDFMGSWRSTLHENIRVGFTTVNPKGFLLGFSSNISGEYLTIMVSNSGHLRVVFDFGFERQELIFPGKHFGLGQYHDVRIRRKNGGATLVMEVDKYEPMEFHFNIKASADAQFNNIQTMYIGRNESMTEGFVGCISRVEFDDIYPLKLLFQQNGPPNVKSIGTTPIEDFCGVEPTTHPPDRAEKRPPPNLDEDKLRQAYNQTDSAIIGGVLAFLFLALIILLILLGRYVARHKGEYLTQEDKGADNVSDPDAAVVQSRTGHQVTKRREWFI